MAQVDIQLPHHQYRIIIEAGCLDRLGDLVSEIASHEKCALLADQTVFDLYGRQAAVGLEKAGFKVVRGMQASGEEHKTLQTVQGHYDLLLEEKLERRSPVISLGGGVNGDTVGFVAATYLRGVPFIQCPTSLLAMVDASVGGKVGVNVVQGKNLVGSFYQPSLVLIDPCVLCTLAPRELRSGLAECVKHGVIRDAELFEWTEANLDRIIKLDSQALVELVQRNVALKAQVVMEDEKEHGVRAILNFGHTFGHAIEKTSGYGIFAHGEAVGLGMIVASQLASERGHCTEALRKRIESLLERIGLPIRAKLAPIKQLNEAMTLDKKVQDGQVRVVIPDCLGAVTIVNDVKESELKTAWESICE